MEIPVVNNREILDELLINYRSAFPEIRRFRHFSELISVLNNSEKRSVAHLNSIISDHANQSNMNRFLSSKIDEDLIFHWNVNPINTMGEERIKKMQGGYLINSLEVKNFPLTCYKLIQICKPMLYCNILNWCEPYKGREMLMNNSPPCSVYTKELVEYANRIRDAQRLLSESKLIKSFTTKWARKPLNLRCGWIRKWLYRFMQGRIRR